MLKIPKTIYVGELRNECHSGNVLLIVIVANKLGCPKSTYNAILNAKASNLRSFQLLKMLSLILW